MTQGGRGAGAGRAAGVTAAAYVSQPSALPFPVEEGSAGPAACACRAASAAQLLFWLLVVGWGLRSMEVSIEMEERFGGA